MRLRSDRFGRVVGPGLVVLLFGAGGADAQVFSPASRTLFARAWMLRSDLVVARASTLLQDGREIPDPADRKATTTLSVHMVVYGARRNLSLIAVIPAASQSIGLRAEGREVRSHSTGLGDLQLLAQYDGLYQRNWDGGAARLAAVAGVKLPTGSAPFTTDSTDAIGGLIFSRFGSRWWFSGDAEVRVRGSGRGIDWGNVLSYDGGLVYRVRKAPEQKDLFLVLELNGESEFTSRVSGRKLPDAGGDRLFLSPAVEFLLRPNLILEGGVQFPIRQDLNGTQLGQNFRVLVGLRYVIF